MDVDGVIRQALAAPASGELRAEQRSDTAVYVADGQLDAYWPADLERHLGLSDKLLIQRLIEVVVLRPGAVQILSSVRVGGLSEDGRQVEPVRLPVVDRRARLEHLGVANRLGDRAESERRQVLAHFLADELEEIDDELRFAGEALAQLRVLRRDADRTGVQVTDAHHHAAADDQRRTGEAELFGAEQHRDHDVPPGLELPVTLHDDAIAQTVLDQRLLRLGDAQLPRRAGVLD